MREPIPQGDALKLQLAGIAGNEPTSSRLEIRPLTIGGGFPADERCWVPIRDFPRRARTGSRVSM